MHRSAKLLGSALVLGLVAGCTKTSSSSDTTATAAAPVDTQAEEAKIKALDSAWMRQVMAKDVDSLMMLYSSDAASYGFGSAPQLGSDQVRAGYTEFVKSAITDPSITWNTVKISDDGNMAYDHGTYAMTVTPPGGKPTRTPGAFLNVWRKEDGQWKLVAEMSTPLAAPK
jgi:uncharacterized protein (TIGR02246 family)